jgi:parvulin-like peptidyl-prolyl isomerase
MTIRDHFSGRSAVVAALLAQFTVACAGSTATSRTAPMPAQGRPAAEATAEQRTTAPAQATAASPSATGPAAASANGPAASGPGGAAAKSGVPADLRIPLLDRAFETTPAARVDDEVITVGELVETMAESHEDAARKGVASAGAAKKRDVFAVLERLIELRLFVVEARDMKLDELPEVKKAIEDHEKLTARELLKRRAVRGVTPDAADVASKVKEATREWKVKSVVFHFEVDAKDMRKQLDAGGSFDELAEAARKMNQVKAITPGEYLPPEKMLPQVRAALETAKVGQVTKPLQVPGGFALLAVEEVRNRENPAVQAAAEQASVTNRSVSTLRQYFQSLIKKHAKVETKAIDRLDLEAAKPGIDALVKSQRPLATIKGEKPITVGDLATEIQSKFFHGVESAAKEKRVNKEKWDTFDQMLFRRLLQKEAAVERISETAEYKKDVASFAREQIFGVFLQRALLPEVKVTEAEVRAYYDAHRAEYTYPRFYKLDSIAFDSAQNAQAALDALRSGNDLKWVREHSEGHADESRLAYKFDRTFSATAIPAELAALLDGAKRGDARVFAADDEKYYLVQIADDKPAEVRSFEDARQEITKQLYGERANELLKSWAAKLRSGHDVEVFITRIG